MMTLRMSRLAAGILLASSLGPVLGQAQATPPPQQPASVAEAARKARENRPRSEPAKVYTNENISEVRGVVSVVGTPPPQPPAAPAEGQTTATAEGAPGAAATPAAGAQGAAAAPAAEVKDEAYWRAQFAEARRKLAADAKELDILQREYNLKQQQFYLDPNTALREQFARTDLNKTLETINAKKLDVERDQQEIANLEDQLRQAGGNPGWAREPAPAN
jgi:hypothetical protein